MTPEMQKDVDELKQEGWEADDSPRAVAKHYQFPSYSETLNFLIDLGETAEEFEVMPSVEIESGTEVTVRIGREPAPALSRDEIGLAKSLAAAA